MQQQSRTVHTVAQAERPESRHLPLVDLLIDTRAELTELVVRSGMKVLEAMLEEAGPTQIGMRDPGRLGDHALRPTLNDVDLLGLAGRDRALDDDFR